MLTPAGGPDVQAAFCAVLCDEWVRAGVTDAVVAPGSRSTPMLAALDGAPGIRVTVVLDERSAGFTALGLGLASGRPALVVTTSGTASVELHPAVVEASQALVPLIAVTTDRPPELHHVGAAQTVEQAGLFGSAIRWAADPGVADLGSSGMWRSLAARCVAEATAGGAGPGPVHLNLPFREPLLGEASAVEVPVGRPDGRPWHSVPPVAPGAPGPELLEILSRLAGAPGLIVAGQGAAADGDPSPVLRLAELLGWPVLAEPRSGCRVPSPWVVSAADSLLRTAAFESRVPAAVLRIGAPWASKVLNQWLARRSPAGPEILVDPWGRWSDPERRASHLARTTAAVLADGLQATGLEAAPPSDWVGSWQAGERSARAAIDRLLGPEGALALSEPAVASACWAAAAPGGTLFVSSSMPVRDVEWYGPPLAGVRALSNRGANGIDGVVSTALGVTMADPDRPTIGLVGDLAFLYDAGALLRAAERPARLRLVVVDNDGGGIFSFLPQAVAFPPERFERYWGTPHGIDLVGLAGAYGVPAERISTRADLDRFLVGPDRYGTGVRVAVVPSERVPNVAAHDGLHAAVAEAVA